MPIRQPVHTTIRISDFYNKAFSFPVESTVDSNHSGQSLVINATGGYLLTTSLTNDPAQEQSFPYIQQPNGQWIAGGIVTILVAGDYFLAGKISVHEPPGETVVLTIEATSTLSKLPELTVTYPTLTITQSLADKPGFILLTVAQQQANTPITINTDLPAYFQLASDSQPLFGPSLTFVPSPAGTIIHVRYFSDKRGSHTGLLTIEAPYEHKTIKLTGQRKGLLPGLQKTTALTRSSTSNSSKPSATKRWVTIVLVSFIGVSGYIGHRYSCQLFPAMCQSESLKPVLLPDTVVGSIPDKLVIPPAKPPMQTARKLARRPAADPTENARGRQLSDEPDKQPLVRRTRTDTLMATKQQSDKAKKGRVRSKSDPTPSDKESELEKALNHPR